MNSEKMYHTTTIKTMFGIKFGIIDNTFTATDGKIEVITMNIHGGENGKFYSNNGHEVDAETIVEIANMVTMRATGKPVEIVNVTCCHPKACKASNDHPAIRVPFDWEGETGIMDFADGSGHVIVAPIEAYYR